MNAFKSNSYFTFIDNPLLFSQVLREPYIPLLISLVSLMPLEDKEDLFEVQLKWVRQFPGKTENSQ